MKAPLMFIMWLLVISPGGTLATASTYTSDETVSEEELIDINGSEMEGVEDEEITDTGDYLPILDEERMEDLDADQDNEGLLDEERDYPVERYREDPDTDPDYDERDYPDERHIDDRG